MRDDRISGLRPYQVEAESAIREAWENGARAVMMQMATGAGKTRLFVNLIAGLRVPLSPTLSSHKERKGGEVRVLIVTHREELVEQVSETLAGHYHLEHGIMQGKNTRDLERRIVVASIQSWRRMRELVEEFDYIIIDEAHHALAETYRELWEAYPQANILGVTATPYRLKAAAFTELFDVLLESWPMRRMIEEGYLASYRMFTVSENKASVRKINRLTKFGVDGDYKTKDLQEIMAGDEEVEFVYECYRQTAIGRKGIVYAVNREHARKIAERFAREGVAAVAIDSKTKAKERKEKIEAFKDGKIEVLVNVELFTEGFDCPSIEFVLLARPTRSLALYMQMVGRALRPASPSALPSREGALALDEGDRRGLVLDCVGLRGRFGMPDRARNWQAHFRGERPKGEEYEKRGLGEPGSFPLLREVTVDDGARLERKPAREILPSKGSVHVFRDNERGLYGTCHENGEVIEKALYNEIRPTPYGWYQGFYREFDDYYPVVFNKQGEECLMCTSLKKVECNVYEAVWKDCAIRFDLHLKVIPKETIERDGTTIYQISHNGRRLYAASLRLGEGMN